MAEHKDAPRGGDPDRHAIATMLGLRLENGAPVLDSKSLLKSLGGVLGILESAVPSFAFLMVWLITKSPVAAVIAGASPVLLFAVIRMARKQPLMQVFSGVAIAALSAYFALRSGGNTTEYFLPGIWTNVAYLGVLSVSVAIRWPLVGVLFGWIFQHGTSWRRHKAQRSPYTAATLALCAIFAIRLLFELPLFWMGAFAALALTKLVLGLPLYALGLWTAWLLARKGFQGQSN